jgi:multiple sugar transport system substrate-binding protein
MKKRNLFLFIGLFLIFQLLVGSSWAAQKGKIRVIFTDTYAPHVKRIETLIDEYKKANPEAEITLEVLTWGDVLPKVTATKAAGSPPDLLLIIPEQIWTLQQQGWLLPTDDLIEKLGGDKFFRPLPAYVKLDGKHWCVPKGSSPLHLEYRKDLFEKKGLKEPRTWDDLLKAAKTLTEDLDGDGKIDRYGISLPLKRDYAVAVMFASFMWGNGGSILDQHGKVVFNSPETVQSLNFFKELYKYAPPGVTDYSWLQLVETYSQDKAAMTIYSGMAPFSKAIETNPTVAQGTAVSPLPTRLSNQTPRARWTTTAWSIMKDTKYPELAKDFILFFFDVNRMIKYYHADPIFTGPGEKPVIESKEYWSNNVIQKYRHILEQYIKAADGAIDPIMEHPGVMQPNTSIILQRLIVTDCVQEVVLGKFSAEEAAARAHKRMEELVTKPK